ncbi:uncharacterized protein ATC70_003340 [Mucor velutinosus]|uniref:Reverse transcriptase domain-containing protein n=1 Tax=Mucor velutinosus TaxID=708070 RepID=A0AAN7DDC6_9FUNG|nr:hypothetical protein ATC70_003340 [Mucor velutinosus]
MNNFRDAAPSDPNVTVLLDQEKAYDRVSPTYLTMVLHQFALPASLVDSISGLFIDTRIPLSINGWPGAPIEQRRGLRQGDSLSSLMFDLAFEPFLRTILACADLRGVIMSTDKRPTLARRISVASAPIEPQTDHVLLSAPASPPRVKMLSYADDLEAFLASPAEWPVLLSLLSLYGKASNAKVNLEKTVLVSLFGKPHDDWKHLADSSNVVWLDESFNWLCEISRLPFVPYRGTVGSFPGYYHSEGAASMQFAHEATALHTWQGFGGKLPSSVSFVAYSSCGCYTQLIASLLSVLPDTNILACLRPRITAFLQYLFNALCPFEGPPVWIIPDSLRSVMAFTDQERTAMLESSTTPSPPAPSFSHWYIITDPCSKATVDKITLGTLRRSCHPSFDMLRDPAHPPRYRPPHLLLPPRLWRDIWSLCLPAKAFTR